MPRRPALPGQTLAFRARPEGANFCVAFKLQGGWDSEIIGKSVASLRAEGLRLLRVDFWVEDVGIMKTIRCFVFKLGDVAVSALTFPASAWCGGPEACSCWTRHGKPMADPPSPDRKSVV